MTQEYYYIPFHPVVDAIKYRVSKLTSIIKAQFTPSTERKEYLCTKCGAEWTQLEVLSRVGPEGFECDKCGATLERADEVHGATGADQSGHEKNSRLMAQLDKVLSLLKQIDSVEIPPNDFDSAWEHKVDIVREGQTQPAKPAIVVSKGGKPATVRSNAKTDAANLEVSLTSTAEKSAADQAAEAARKAAVEKQNTLPVWHTSSTVTTNGDTTAAIPEPSGGAMDIIKSEEKEEKKPQVDEGLDDRVAAYYAEMAKEEERKAKEEITSDGGDEDEDDEFEDVDVSASNGNDPTRLAAPPSNASVQSLKRERDSESDSSAPPTNNCTPYPPVEDAPAAKKPKAEPTSKVEAPIKEEPQSDEDEEFEDV